MEKIKPNFEGPESASEPQSDFENKRSEKIKPNFEGPESASESRDDYEKERRERIERLLLLVEEIGESGENIPFPGIQQEVYLQMQKDDEEFPGFTTPIDEIIERCGKEGIKIVLGKNPKSGNIYVLPAGSDNIEMDSLVPRQLVIDSVKNEALKELIRLMAKKEEKFKNEDSE